MMLDKKLIIEPLTFHGQKHKISTHFFLLAKQLLNEMAHVFH